MGEVIRCFKAKGICIATAAYSGAEGLRDIFYGKCPDVLFYDMDGERGLIHQTAAAAIGLNNSLIAVATRNDKPIGAKASSYSMPVVSRKHIWLYACLAYDACIENRDNFTYYARPDYVNISVNDVIYFFSEGRKTHLVSRWRRDMFYKRLDEVEGIIKLKRGHFVRIHQSYLINTRYVAEYSRDYVTLLNNERLRISNYEYYRMLDNSIRHYGYL
jgi:hypothetical protein